MKTARTLFLYAAVLALILSAPCAAAAETAPAETAPVETEQGLTELQSMLEIAGVQETAGMSLEEMTEAFSGTVMSEYVDSASGFSMQYPSAFVFDEEKQEAYAATADGKATLTVDHIVNENGLEEDDLIEAIRLELPDASILRNEQNGCLRVERSGSGGKKGQTDLYLLTDHYFHHIVLRYPAEEQGTYFSYIEYMINTIETNDTDLG